MGQVILSDRMHLPVDLDVPTGQANAVRLAYSSVTIHHSGGRTFLGPDFGAHLTSGVCLMAAVSYYQTANTAPECRAEDVRVFDSDAGPCLAWPPTPWENALNSGGTVTWLKLFAGFGLLWSRRSYPNTNRRI